MKASELLWNAADHVEAGWCQHVLEDEAGNVCTLGAMGRAFTGIATGSAFAFVREDPTYSAAHRALMKQIASRTGTPNCAVAEWNNAPERTQADVVTTMQKAAIGLEEQGL